MTVLVFFGVVILFSLTLNVIDKIRAYNDKPNRSIWQDGDSVIVKPKDTQDAGGGFAKRLDNGQE